MSHTCRQPLTLGDAARREIFCAVFFKASPQHVYSMQKPQFTKRIRHQFENHSQHYPSKYTPWHRIRTNEHVFATFGCLQSSMEPPPTELIKREDMPLEQSTRTKQDCIVGAGPRFHPQAKFWSTDGQVKNDSWRLQLGEIKLTREQSTN